MNEARAPRPGAMDRILFLDFDGVLHPNLCSVEDRFQRVPLLWDCLLSMRMPVQIVISSSWRFHYSIDELRAFFPEDLRHRVVATTGPAIIGKYSRYREIQAYLSKRKGAARWCALDDTGWEFPSNVPELLLCNGGTGMTPVEAVRLRAWFDREGC